MNTTLKGGIEKGVYAHNQIEGYISVKEFIIMKQSNKRCLLIRYANDSDFEIHKFEFILTQLDASGKVIKRNKYQYTDLSIKPGETYSPNNGIVIDEECSDFTVRMLSLYSDPYHYIYKRGHITVHYDIKEYELPAAESSINTDLGNSSISIRRRYVGGKRFYKFIAGTTLAMIILSFLYVMFVNSTR